MDQRRWSGGMAVGAAGGLRRPGATGRSAREPYRKLKPGPGRSAAAVAADQRSRIQRAMIETVAERGYDAVKVNELSSLAGVSKRAFYSHFGGREECLLATYDSVVRGGLRATLASARVERDCREQLRCGLLGFANEIASRPAGARLALIEAFAGGPPALAKMQHAAGLFEASIASSFSRAPVALELPPALGKGIVAGVAQVARERLLAGSERELPLEAGELLSWALSFGSEASTEVGEAGAPSCPSPNPATPSQAALDAKPVLASDDRAVILAAVTRLAARDGYEALSVPSIRRAAGVSRRRFDAHFDAVVDCFLAALELYAGCAVAEATSAYASAPTWPGGVQRAVVAVCDHLVGDPVLARLAFIEVFSSGPDGVRWRARFIADIGGLLRASAPPSERPSKLGTEASVAAAWAVIHHYVASGRTRELSQAVPTLSHLILAPALGADAALAAIRSEPSKGAGSQARRPRSWPMVAGA